ncbi:MAG: hypothetical protein QXI69_01635 [Candidatus Nitrosocaldus sp.]
MSINSSKSRDLFWRRVIGDGLISIPSSERWVTERINYQALAKHFSVNFNTVDMLSIDSYEQLPSYFKRLDCGIIRLGYGIQKNTADFILCKPTKGAQDLYLFNDRLFYSDSSYGNGIDDNEYDIIARLLQRIDRLDERAGLNLFSYLFQFKDIFNMRDSRILSFSYKTTHTFKFIIESGLEPVEFINGQIEVDLLLLLTSKEGQYKVVVIEAKSGSNNRSIAKHKILYSTMVAKRLFPDTDDILPAYLHITDEEGEVSFNFCTLKMDYRDGMPVLTSLTAKDTYSIKISRNNK